MSNPLHNHQRIFIIPILVFGSVVIPGASPNSNGSRRVSSSTPNRTSDRRSWIIDPTSYSSSFSLPVTVLYLPTRSLLLPIFKASAFVRSFKASQSSSTGKPSSSSLRPFFLVYPLVLSPFLDLNTLPYRLLGCLQLSLRGECPSI